jgi:hypothetical protein
MDKMTKKYLEYQGNPELISADYPALKGHEKEMLGMLKKAATEERPQMAGMYSPEAKQLFGWYAEHDKERIAQAGNQTPLAPANPKDEEEQWDSPEELQRERERVWIEGFNKMGDNARRAYQQPKQLPSVPPPVEKPQGPPQFPSGKNPPPPPTPKR